LVGCAAPLLGFWFWLDVLHLFWGSGFGWMCCASFGVLVLVGCAAPLLGFWFGEFRFSWLVRYQIAAIQPSQFRTTQAYTRQSFAPQVQPDPPQCGGGLLRDTEASGFGLAAGLSESQQVTIWRGYAVLDSKTGWAAKRGIF